jgi:hypothetical protein
MISLASAISIALRHVAKKNVTETTTRPKWSIFARRRWGAAPAESIAVIQNGANPSGNLFIRRPQPVGHAVDGERDEARQ